MKNKIIKPTLSIGIPAHNEEGNIEFLLKSIFRQKQHFFILEKVYVICDSCTDNTVNIVSRLSKKYKNLKIVERKKKSGKANNLNLIYKLNQSEYILAIDADLVFQKNTDIEEMIKVIAADKDLNVVVPRHIPVPASSWMGKFAVVSYLSFADALWKLNDGNNFYASMATYLLRKKFSKTIHYPKEVQADQTILYALATRKNKNAFKLVKNAGVYFRTATTFMDWRILGVRSVLRDKANTVEFFGEEILKEYHMPRKLFITSLIKWFFKDPISTIGSVLMNIYIRKFPLKSKMPVGGLWEPVESSKVGIQI